MSSVMDRDAALGDFLEKYVLERWQEDLAAIGEHYEKNQAEIEAGFLKAVDTACMQAVHLQEQQLKGDIQYIYLSLLRTSIMEHQAVYRIDVLDERWFLDPSECVVQWQADFIFNPLFQRIAALDNVKSNYARKISAMDVERILQIEAYRYHLFAIEFMRGLVPSILEGEGFLRMGQKPTLCILAGEFRDQSEILFQAEGGGDEAGGE
ncbi:MULTISPECIES: hypothetical protein [Paenibacillus]|nr:MULTISPECIES: hypothetical protein [Paenibacillus]